MHSNLAFLRPRDAERHLIEESIEMVDYLIDSIGSQEGGPGGLSGARSAGRGPGSGLGADWASLTALVANRVGDLDRLCEVLGHEGEVRAAETTSDEPFVDMTADQIEILIESGSRSTPGAQGPRLRVYGGASKRR